jgi:hypothetical protein
MQKENCKGEEHKELPRDPLEGHSYLSSPHKRSLYTAALHQDT